MSERWELVYPATSRIVKPFSPQPVSIVFERMASGVPVVELFTGLSPSDKERFAELLAGLQSSLPPDAQTPAVPVPAKHRGPRALATPARGGSVQHDL